MVSCKVTLQVDPPCECRRIYSPLDEITGKVLVSTKRPVSLHSIHIKLSGDLTTFINDFYFDQRGKKKKLPRTESHELLFDAATLFPPREVQLYSKSKSYILPEGNFEYPFKFKLPKNAACGDRLTAQYYSHMYNTESESLCKLYHRKQDERVHKHLISILPPSIPLFKAVSTEDIPFSFSIIYELKVTVRRSSLLKYNIRRIIPLDLRPLCSSMIASHNLASVTPTVMQAEGSMFNIPITLHIEMARSVYRESNPFKSFKIVAGVATNSIHGVGNLFLTRLKMNLVKEITVNASNKDLYFEEQQSILDLKQVTIPVLEKEDEVDDAALIDLLNRTVCIPETTDVLESCCLLVNYRIEIGLEFKEDSRGLTMAKTLTISNVSVFSCYEGFTCHKIMDSLLQPLHGMSITHPLRVDALLRNDRENVSIDQYKSHIRHNGTSPRIMSCLKHTKARSYPKTTTEQKDSTNQSERPIDISFNINLGNDRKNEGSSYEQNYQRFINEMRQNIQSDKQPPVDTFNLYQFFADANGPKEQNNEIPPRGGLKSQAKSITSYLSLGLPSYQEAVGSHHGHANS